jgi:hypothetical protein
MEDMINRMMNGDISLDMIQELFSGMMDPEDKQVLENRNAMAKLMAEKMGERMTEYAQGLNEGGSYGQEEKSQLADMIRKTALLTFFGEQTVEEIDDYNGNRFYSFALDSMNFEEMSNGKFRYGGKEYNFSDYLTWEKESSQSVVESLGEQSENEKDTAWEDMIVSLLLDDIS